MIINKYARYDQMYIKYFTGIKDVKLLPSYCNYITATYYFPSKYNEVPTYVCMYVSTSLYYYDKHENNHLSHLFLMYILHYYYYRFNNNQKLIIHNILIRHNIIHNT